MDGASGTGFVDASWRLAGRNIATPFVGVHYERLLANIGHVARIGRERGVAVRPHAKTHKTLEIARRQIDAGAVGVTTSRHPEALTYITAGITSVTVAYPIVARKIATRLVAATRPGCDVRFVVDSPEGIAACAAAASNGPVSIFFEIDVGLGRCGVGAGSRALEQLAASALADKNVRFVGLLSHAGHAYGAADRTEVQKIAHAELEHLALARDQLESLGLAVSEVSIGSTPTVLAAESFAGATEIRPGNYVFLDQTACRLGVAEPGSVALGVISTVISTNAQYCIVDAGSKTLSSDKGPHGTSSGSYGLAFPLDDAPYVWAAGRPITRLSEEHGFIEHGGRPLKIGSRLAIMPAHSCPVANLAQRLVAFETSGGCELWRVAAGGSVH